MKALTKEIESTLGALLLVPKHASLEQDQTTQGLSETQTKALEDLQTTTQKAAQFVGQAKAPFTQTNTPQNSPIPSQPTKVQ